MIKKNWLLFALFMLGFVFLFEFKDGLYEKYFEILALLMLLLFDFKKSNWNFIKKLNFLHFILFLLALDKILISNNNIRIATLILSLIFVTIIINLKKSNN
jgi:hypothetical protein